MSQNRTQSQVQSAPSLSIFGRQL